MPKKNRLSGAEIRRLVPIKRLNSGLFSLSISKAAGLPKISCVVSKKVSHKAVVRNRVKRRMRAALRELPLPAGTASILSAKPGAATAEYTAIREDIAELIARSVK